MNARCARDGRRGTGCGSAARASRRSSPCGQGSGTMTVRGREPAREFAGVDSTHWSVCSNAQAGHPLFGLRSPLHSMPTTLPSPSSMCTLTHADHPSMHMPHISPYPPLLHEPRAWLFSSGSVTSSSRQLLSGSDFMRLGASGAGGTALRSSSSSRSSLQTVSCQSGGQISSSGSSLRGAARGEQPEVGRVRWTKPSTRKVKQSAAAAKATRVARGLAPPPAAVHCRGDAEMFPEVLRIGLRLRVRSVWVRRTTKATVRVEVWLRLGIKFVVQFGGWMVRRRQVQAGPGPSGWRESCHRWPPAGTRCSTRATPAARATATRPRCRRARAARTVPPAPAPATRECAARPSVDWPVERRQ